MSSMMFEQLNELVYTAATGKKYTIYFLKFWKPDKKKNDYVVKYQLRTSDGDFVWYGRTSRQRVMADLKISKQEYAKMRTAEVEQTIEKHLKKLLLYVMKRGLDKGFEDPNTEFIFYVKPLMSKRVWGE
jgi:hypothetical protein